MKKLTLLVALLLVGILFSACTNGTSEEAQEGFDFSDEERVESSAMQGFDFTNDESSENNSNPSPDLPGDVPDNQVPGLNFDDDEGLVISSNNNHVLPREGLSTWLVSQGKGTATCVGNTIPIWGSEDEIVTLNVGVESAGFELNGLDGAGSMFYIQLDSGPGGSSYMTDFVPPGANSPMRYEILFTNLSAEGNVADFMMGDISGTAEGCDIYRPFQGTLQD